MNISVHSAVESPIDIPVRRGETEPLLGSVNLTEAEMQEAWSLTAKMPDSDDILTNILWLRANKDIAAKYYH